MTTLVAGPDLPEQRSRDESDGATRAARVGARLRGPGSGPRRLWPYVVVYATVALLATLTSSPGRWIADARLEFSVDPVGFVAGHQHVWDGTRGMGSTATWYSPVLGSYQALLSLVGAEPWVIERLVHTALLTLAASSAAFLMRLVLPGRAVAVLVAGLVYAFNPYTSQFLVPSGLFLSYALSPLLLAAFLSGVADPAKRWRTAAVFALGVFATGAHNTAVLLYAASPVLVAIVYLVAIERSVSFGSVVRWAGCALALTLGVSIGALVVLWFQRGDVALNLATTERPEVVSRNSSWAESWRGLGLWLTYFTDRSGPSRPQAGPYFTNPLVVAASFVAPLVAIMTLLFARWRGRWFFAGLLVAGVVVMVGLWPVDASPVFGRALAAAFDNVVVLRGLRTTYKAGSVVMVAIALLVAAGLSIGWRTRTTPSIDRVRRLGVLAAGAGLVVAAFPFWTGSLYSNDEGFDELPSYWVDAIDWVNERPEDGRVLVLPSAVRSRYRWGYVNDNLFHGLLDKSLVANQSIPPPGTPVAADVVRHLDEYVVSPAFEPETLAPMLRRLGVRWVLIQNDLDWQRLELERPVVFDAVRSDPDLRRVAGFGRPGQNTSAPDDDAAPFLGEDELRPVEIFEVTGAAGTFRVDPRDPTIVAGGGDSWAQLAAVGRLDGGPVAYSDQLSDAELVDLARAGSPIVVTDGARRRSLQVRPGRVAQSHTLALSEEFYRDPVSPFSVSGQSVAVYADARTIEATRVGNGALPFDPSIRPAMAFDGREDTAWSVTGAGAEGAALEVELLTPTAIDQVTVSPFAGTADRFADRVVVEVETATGDVVSQSRAVPPDQPTEVRFDRRVDDVVGLRILLASISGPGASAVGVSDVVVMADGAALDLREFVRTPVDLAEAAAGSSEVAAALERAPLSYSFRRALGTRVAPEEVDLRRVSWAPDDTTVGMSGSIQLSAVTPDEVVDHLVGGPVGAVGTRDRSEAGGWGVWAVDGDVSTSWLGRPTPGSRLTARLGGAEAESLTVVTSVSVGADDETVFSAVDRLRVVARGAQETSTASATAATICDETGVDRRCTRTFTFPLPRDRYDSVDLVIDDVDAQATAFGVRPVAVDELLLDDAPIARQPDDGCVDGFEVAGEVVAIRLEEPVGRLLAGERVRFIGCDDVGLPAGVWSLESSDGLAAAVIDVVLETPQPEVDGGTVAETFGVVVVEESPTRLVVAMSGGASGTLLGPGAFHPGWRASVDGVAMDGAVARDALSAWQVTPSSDDPATPVLVTIEFRPQRSYELAVSISAGVVALCLALAVARPRRKA